MNYTLTKISCYTGYLVQAVIINFLPLLFVTLNTDYGISLTRLGALSVITFAVQLCVDVLSVKFLKHIGFRGGAVLAHFMATLGLVMLSVLPVISDNTFLAIALSVVVYSIGGGLIEVIISPIIEYLPTRNKAAQMSLLHSFYCWGQLLTVIISTVLFGLFGRDNWRYLSLLWATIPFVNMLAFLKAPIIEPQTDVVEKTDKSTVKTPIFHIMLLLMLCAGASEIAVSQWSSTFAEVGLGLSKAAGDLLGPCAFALLMGLGRLVYGLFGNDIKIEKVMLVCAVLCFVCYIMLFLNLHPVVSVIASALCGLSVSVMWPGTISLTASRFKNSGTLVFGLLAAAGDVGCSVGPLLFGFIADRFNMPFGFMVTSVFPVIIIAVLGYFLKYGCKNKRNILK